MALRLRTLFLAGALLFAASPHATAQDISNRYYPAAARQQGVGGMVALECLVAESGRIDCTAASETPPEYGFADAAVRASRQFRMAPRTRDGVATAGGRVRMCIVFEPPSTIRKAQDCGAATS